MYHKMDIALKIITGLLLNLPYVSACGDNYTELTGIFTSPDYDTRNAYPPNSDCEWTISTPEGTDIVLIFLHFEIRCPDYISMTDLSNNTMMPILDKQCFLNEEIYFLGNKIHIHFVSDGSGQRKGFKIIWKVKSILTWHSEFVSVHEAHGICRRQGGSLVKDIAEYQDEIVDMMQERHVTSIWQAKNKYKTPWVWLKGCFSFANLDDFETYVIVKNNSMAECQRLCSKWNYFGLQSDKCFCIESYAGSPVIMDHYCTISCSGNYEERCGGNLSLTIYMNDICYTNSSAWQGTVSRTKEGNTCLPWNNITAIIHDNTTVFPDGSAQNASNFCRNPSGSEALWCYVNQNETEFCDVPPCFHKETSNENCMAVYKSNSNELVFKRRPCTEGERAICYDVGEDGYVIDSKLTWTKHRQDIWRGSLSNCKSLVGPSLFFMDKGRLVTFKYYYFIGQYRSSITSTDIYSEIDNHQCYTIEVRDNQMNEGVTDCDSKRNFICQTAPVTCGGEFDSLANYSFSTPGFPSGYSPLTRCKWTILVPEDHFIMLTIDVDIEDSLQCRYDYLNIYFGMSTNDNLKSTLCGRIVKEFDNLRTNVTLEFLSDNNKNSHGIFVMWITVPITTSTATTISTSTTVSTTVTEGYNRQVYVENNVDLSNGEFAGIIVAVVVLLVLSCLGGYLFGTRRRPLHRKDNDMHHEEMVENSGYINGGVAASHSNDELDDGYSTTKSFTNAGFEGGPSGIVQIDARQNSDKDRAEVRGNSLALYSVVNKSPKSAFPGSHNNSAPETMAENMPDHTYNRLNEKHGDAAQNVKQVNVYNRVQEEDPLYNNTVLPPRNINRNDMSPKIDPYDHKKNDD